MDFSNRTAEQCLEVAVGDSVAPVANICVAALSPDSCCDHSHCAPCLWFMNTVCEHAKETAN